MGRAANSLFALGDGLRHPVGQRDSRLSAGSGGSLDRQEG
jgi:hypothetical protein